MHKLKYCSRPFQSLCVNCASTRAAAWLGKGGMSSNMLSCRTVILRRAPRVFDLKAL